MVYYGLFGSVFSTFALRLSDTSWSIVIISSGILTAWLTKKLFQISFY